MSLREPYERRVECTEHPACRLEPYERCVAATGRGSRCKNRAAPGSLYCAQSHGAPNWDSETMQYRRGHPLEVLHVRRRRNRRERLGVLVGPSMQLALAWGPLSETQATEATVNLMVDDALEEMLR